MMDSNLSTVVKESLRCPTPLLSTVSSAKPSASPSAPSPRSCANSSPNATPCLRPGTPSACSPPAVRPTLGPTSPACWRRPGFDADAAHALITRLETDGLIRGDAELGLTPAGEAQYQSLREDISGPSTRLLSQFDVDDIETTVRTLQAITAKATDGAL